MRDIYKAEWTIVIIFCFVLPLKTLCIQSWERPCFSLCSLVGWNINKRMEKIQTVQLRSIELAILQFTHSYSTKKKLFLKKKHLSNTTLQLMTLLA